MENGQSRTILIWCYFWGELSFHAKYYQNWMKNVEVIKYLYVKVPQAIVPYGATAQKKKQP